MSCPRISRPISTSIPVQPRLLRLLIILNLLIPRRAILLNNKVPRDDAQSRQSSKQPPRKNDRARLNAARKRSSNQRGKQPTTKRTETRPDAIQSAENGHARCGVCEQDSAAGNPERRATEFCEQQQQNGRDADSFWDENDKGRDEVDYWQKQSRDFIAVQHTEALCQRGEAEKLNEHAENADYAVVEADSLGI